MHRLIEIVGTLGMIGGARSEDRELLKLYIGCPRNSPTSLLS